MCQTSDDLESLRIAEKLRKGGYPERHIRKLGEMHGEGLTKADELSEIVIKGDFLLVLCGDRGSGKTQIMTHWGSVMYESSGYAGLYYKAHDLLEKIRQKFEGGKFAIEADKVLKAVRNTRYLAIDEFSELKGSEWELQTLTNLIDHRYDQRKGTAISTNHARAKVAETVGRSVYSRVQETGGVVDCNWASYRGR